MVSASYSREEPLLEEVHLISKATVFTLQVLDLHGLLQAPQQLSCGQVSSPVWLRFSKVTCLSEGQCQDGKPRL